MYIKLVLNLARGQSEGMKAALTGLGWWQAGIYCRVSTDRAIECIEQLTAGLHARGI